MDRLVISFVRSLPAANLSGRTQQSYEDGRLQLSAFLAAHDAHGVGAIRREHAEAWIEDPAYHDARGVHAQAVGHALLVVPTTSV